MKGRRKNPRRTQTAPGIRRGGGKKSAKKTLTPKAWANTQARFMQQAIDKGAHPLQAEMLAAQQMREAGYRMRSKKGHN